jgi:hypothetical protein
MNMILVVNEEGNNKMTSDPWSSLAPGFPALYDTGILDTPECKCMSIMIVFVSHFSVADGIGSTITPGLGLPLAFPRRWTTNCSWRVVCLRVVSAIVCLRNWQFVSRVWL